MSSRCTKSSACVGSSIRIESMDLLRFQNFGSLHAFTLILLSFYVSSSLLITLPPAAAAAAAAAALPAMENKTTTDPRLALLSFKSLLSDPLGSLSSWNNSNNGSSLHYCTWRGVTCGRRHPQQVVALDLDSLGLAGPISPSVSNLTFLARLHLPYNQLHGSIPDGFGRLSRLRYLNLSMNYLQGEIPATLSHCSYLQIISISDNKLSGAIPPNFTRCLNLQILSMRNNFLSGEIPADIGSLPMLETLNLGGNSLTGRIPPLLGSSPSLANVGLWNNSLAGVIPHFLANSSTLQILVLQGNTLTGGIPPSFGNSSSLIHIDLVSNRLTGRIPPFLNSPSPLRHLFLSENQLAGDIPPSLGNLSSLQYLFLDDNKLGGGIPESLGNIPRLQVLELSINNLSNIIHSSLYNLSTITLLGLGFNRLFGTLPPDMGLALPDLQILMMSDNKLEGPIPTSMSNATGLEIIYFTNNFFSGVVPADLGYLRNLRELDFGGNQLHSHDWSFLSSLSNCSLLERLLLNTNKLDGVLPSSVGDLSTQLQYLVLGTNQISGTIPPEIGNLVNLTELYLDDNLFVGTVPSTIGMLRKLQILYLSTNNLSGPIPSSIGNLDQLNGLYMHENQLSGHIPASIGGCKGLGIVNISHNVLGGTIPRELVSLSSLTQYLDLSHNSFVGSVPAEVGQLINLGGLYLSENQLSGDIPPPLGACQLLEHLHMEGNLFQGSIPQSWMGLKGLKDLDLSRNNLSGQIPKFFESFRSLQSLNLSFNDFEGGVPSGGVFSNASEISVLGNTKLCGGYPELRLPPCSAHAHVRQIRPFKVIISTVSGVLFLLLLLFGLLYWWKKRRIRGKSPEASFEGERFKQVSYADIHKATDGFSSANLVGSGSFGSVYKGKIDSEESMVAVKVLNLYRKGASRSFTAECEALRNIRHRNLVRIITACSSVDYRGNDFKALVFEYMPNGSLEKWLYPEVGLEHPQPWKLILIQRLNIAFDVASALDYLHHSCQPPVVHCDLKPSNILLDNDMMAHVGDFGLARFLSKPISAASKSSTSSIGIKGTVGYVAPEYGMGGQISTQGDVYSFGVLLLEMLTGKKPTDDMFKDGINLRRYVEMALPEGVVRILDPQLVSQDKGEEADDNTMSESITTERSMGCIFSLIRIGLLCSNDAPRERMTMGDVATDIHKIKELFSTAEAQDGGHTA